MLTEYEISHICAKNGGGKWSFAKIEAARQLGLPVWFLARPDCQKGHQHYQVCHSLYDVIAAIKAHNRIEALGFFVMLFGEGVLMAAVTAHL